MACSSGGGTPKMPRPCYLLPCRSNREVRRAARGSYFSTAAAAVAGGGADAASAVAAGAYGAHTKAFASAGDCQCGSAPERAVKSAAAADGAGGGAAGTSSPVP